MCGDAFCNGIHKCRSAEGKKFKKSDPVVLAATAKQAVNQTVREGHQSSDGTAAIISKLKDGFKKKGTRRYIKDDFSGSQVKPF